MIRPRYGRHHGCSAWGFPPSDEYSQRSDLVDYASETADWDMTPEEVGYMLDRPRGHGWEEDLQRIVSRCFGPGADDTPY